MIEPNGEKEEPRTPQQDAEIMLKALPQELQDSIKTFQFNLIKSIFAQQTTMRGDEAIIRVTPDQAEFYEVRMKEVLESGLLNPHINPPLEIKNK